MLEVAVSGDLHLVTRYFEAAGLGHRVTFHRYKSAEAQPRVGFRQTEFAVFSETFRRQGYAYFPVVNIPTGEGFGVGILQKLGSGPVDQSWFPGQGEQLRQILHPLVCRKAGLRMFRWR